MKLLIRKIIIWALDIKEQPPKGAEIELLAKELKGS
jgi:hypothetical protein